MIFSCDKTVEKLEYRIGNRVHDVNGVTSLSIVQVGDNPASNTYVNKKVECCKKFDIECNVIKLPADITQWDLEREINTLNHDSNCLALMVQLPLPDHLDERAIIDNILPCKDADGLTSTRLGQLLSGSKKAIAPCTSKAVMDILVDYEQQYGIKAKNMLIINRSNIVGKPLVPLALNHNLTVNVAHSGTPKELLYNLMANADVIVTATGVKGFINKETVGEIFKRTNSDEKKFIIDVGIIPEGKFIYGDVDRELYDENETRIITTPVPKGVGRLTVLNLLLNSIDVSEEGQLAVNRLIEFIEQQSIKNNSKSNI